jgi:hypothetical protein
LKDLLSIAKESEFGSKMNRGPNSISLRGRRFERLEGSTFALENRDRVTVSANKIRGRVERCIRLREEIREAEKYLRRLENDLLATEKLLFKARPREYIGEVAKLLALMQEHYKKTEDYHDLVSDVQKWYDLRDNTDFLRFADCDELSIFRGDFE